MSFTKLFQDSEISKAYNFRPLFSDQLFSLLNEFSKSRDDNFAGFQSVLDVGCGGGQFTNLLTQVTQPQSGKILGIDVSKTQLEEAKKNTRNPLISFELANAERFPVDDASVDLITIANALHWMDIDQFYGECRRALKKIDCAALAIVCTLLRRSKMSAISATNHENAELNAELTKLWIDYIYDDNYLGRFWEVDQVERESWYDNLQPLEKTKQKYIFEYSHEYSFNALSQYLKSFSAYPLHQKKHPNVDPAQIFMEKIHEIMRRHKEHVEQDAPIVNITYPQMIQIMPIL